jgi:hypothetical protein
MNHRPDQHGTFAMRCAHGAKHLHGPGPGAWRAAGSY